MGFFSWFLDMIKSFFSADVRMQEINKDISYDKKELKIDKKRKKVEKFENETFRLLSIHAHMVFNNTNLTPQARSYKGPLVKFLQKVQEIRDSPGIEKEYEHLQELYSLWQAVSPLLARDFGKDKKIKKAMSMVQDCIRSLAKDIGQERSLLTEEEAIEQQKERLDKEEE